MIVTFYRKSLFEDFVTTSSGYVSLSEHPTDRADFSITIKTRFPYGLIHFQSALQEAVDDLQNLGQTAAEKLQFDNFIARETWHLTFQTQFYSNHSGENGVYAGYLDALDTDTLQICQTFLSSGRLPQGPNETVLLIDEYALESQNLTLEDEVLITSTLNNVLILQNATAKITGIIKYNRKDRWFLQSNTSRNTLWDYFDWSYGPVFITNQDNFLDFVKVIYEDNLITLDIRGQININLDQLDAFNLGNEVTRLEQFRQQLELDGNAFGYAYVYSGIIVKIQSFDFDLAAALIIMLLFGIPTIIATLFLANFSLGLLHGRKRRQIGVLKTRGASPRQILIVLLGESIVALIISVGLGGILGLPFAYLAIQSDRFLGFASGLLSFNFLMGIFQPVILFGILFALLLNFRSIFRMARMDINEGLLPQETKKPLWKKFYLDVILLSTGLLGVLILVLLTDLASVTVLDPDIIILYMLLSFIAFFFGLPSPILITVGGAMLVARLLPVLLRKSAHWTWRLEGGMVAFSFRNVLHRLAHASRATLLISIVIAFSIAFISIPYNADKNTMDNAYYHNLGADITITETVTDVIKSLSLNHTLLHYLQNNLTGVASVSPVAQASGYASSSSINVLGVDINTYAQTAFFREDFLNQDAISALLRLDMIGSFKALMRGDFFPDTPDLNTLLSGLQSSTTFLIQEDNLRAQNINVGEQLSLFFLYRNETTLINDFKLYNFDIVGTFECWPLFIDYQILPTSFDELFMIGNLSTILEYANENLFEISEFNYLIRVNPGVSKSQLKEQILNETGYEAVQVKTIDEDMEGYVSSPTRDV
ncbi:MAG: ABC transporter permease, partial [Promethearchaeota archaeon]